MKSVGERQNELEGKHPVWTPKALHQALASAADRWPDRDFIVADTSSFSYSEMHSWSSRIATGLVDVGIKPGDHVALLMANYPEFVAAKFAISRVGATAVPINFLNRRDELAYVLAQSEARCLIAMDRFRDLNYLEMLDQIVPGWVSGGGGEVLPYLKTIFVLPVSGEPLPAGVQSFEALSDASGSTPELTVDPRSPSDIIYTSGTTGGPKGVLLTHDMLLRTAYGSAYARAMEDGQRILFALPMYHVYGYVEGLLAALTVGGAAVIKLLFDPAAALDSIGLQHVDDILLIPTMTLALLDELEAGDYDVSNLKTMLSSGGKAPPELWDRIFQKFGQIEVTTGYGMSEATASSTVTRPDDPIDKLRFTNGRLRDVGVAGDPQNQGKLVTYRVVDTETEDELPPGEVGELRMKGAGVTRGYYKKPEETATAFDDEGWFRTGDLGVVDPEGYIILKGRTKESYRCGGELVLPLEVEQVLITHSEVSDVHVVAIPDKRMGEVGVACVVAEHLPSVDESELIEFCRQRLARFKVPRHVVFIKPEELPTTATGRPRKFLLVEPVLKKLGLTEKGEKQ
ncbi:acyl-CoA ligase [Luminiphilus syltensis NOR5-1B]|uniref:Acyl-CoA ligase n=1 Tax=Luminiphilus syltensis NOR5-1B TaxID=565045 RepID=B8KUI0_9GAMM|nr:acyl-CoA ligase [Luminiphilus syltensis NOR5-1B]